MDFVPSGDPTNDLQTKRKKNLTLIDSGKLPAEPYHITTTHPKAVKIEIVSVHRQWGCNPHPGLTSMSRGWGAESLSPWGFGFPHD